MATKRKPTRTKPKVSTTSSISLPPHGGELTLRGPTVNRIITNNGPSTIYVGNQGEDIYMKVKRGQPKADVRVLEIRHGEMGVGQQMATTQAKPLRRIVEPKQPPVITQTESVESFLARGGKIKKIPTMTAEQIFLPAHIPNAKGKSSGKTARRNKKKRIKKALKKAGKK